MAPEKEASYGLERGNTLHFVKYEDLISWHSGKNFGYSGESGGKLHN
jgi:hypothetical protein